MRLGVFFEIFVHKKNKKNATRKDLQPETDNLSMLFFDYCFHKDIEIYELRFTA